MPVMSSPSRKKSWQTGRERVSVLAALAIKRDVISRRLLQIREDNRDPSTGEKLTQEDAAARVPVRARTWQRWEAGETVPYPRNLASIADAFGFDVAEFFDREPGTVSDTPHVFDGSIGERLARIEEAVADLRAERDEHAEHVEDLLQRQSELLEDIRKLVAKNEEIMQPDRLAQLVVETNARIPPGEPPTRP